MDCLLIGSRQRLSPRQGPMGTSASGRHLSDPSRWHRAQTHLAARRLLRQPQVDAGQQERYHVLHVGARHVDLSLWLRGRRQPDSEDQYRQWRNKHPCGRARRQAAPGSAAFGRDRLSTPRQNSRRSLLWKRQAGPQGKDLRTPSWSPDGAAGRLQPGRHQAPCGTGEGMESKSEVRLVQQRLATRIRSAAENTWRRPG